MRRLQSIAIALCLLLVGLNVLTGNGGIGNDDLANADSNVPLAGSDPPLVQAPPLPSTIKIWEAHAKGFAPIVSSIPLGMSYIIDNTGSANIIVDEYVMILSPNPFEGGPENDYGNRWSQDGVLTYGTVAPGSSLTYTYGSLAVVDPPWWCTEDKEWIAADTNVLLTGEIIPFDLWDELSNPDEFTQDDIWTYQLENSVLVIGKTPMWKLIPNIPNEVDITLAVTNIGYGTASNVVVEDTLPSGYTLKPGSASPLPDSIITNPDGSTTLIWTLGSLRGEIWKEFADNDPTDYAHAFINYTLETPELVPDSRYFLPRAQVDKNNDGIMDAHSEEPLLETYFVNRPPGAVVGDVEIFEGETAFLNGSSSYDADEAYGDSIVSYEWDFDGDGSADAFGPTASLPYGDNGNYSVTLSVTDSYGASSSTTATITVLNVDPEIISIDVTIYVVNAPRTQGYWSHQCTVTEPYGDHTGILQEWIDSIAAQSQVFAGLSSKDEVCAILDETSIDMSDMLAKAKLQLMALWLNVVSGKLYMDTPLDLPSLTVSATVGEAIDEIESIILSSTDRSELERIKDIADSINNFLGIPEKIAEITADASDLGSDDLTFAWSTGESAKYYNDGANPDPPNSPGGIYPFSASDAIVTLYAEGEVIVLTVEDDDGGSTQVTVA